MNRQPKYLGEVDGMRDGEFEECEYCGCYCICSRMEQCRGFFCRVCECGEAN